MRPLGRAVNHYAFTSLFRMGDASLIPMLDHANSISGPKPRGLSTRRSLGDQPKKTLCSLPRK